MGSRITDQFADFEEFERWMIVKREMMSTLNKDVRDNIIGTFRVLVTASPDLQTKFWNVIGAPADTPYEKLALRRLLQDANSAFLSEQTGASSTIDPYLLFPPQERTESPKQEVESPKEPEQVELPKKEPIVYVKVQKDFLQCSHGKAFCVHNGTGICSLGVACRFCHEPHRPDEQAYLVQNAFNEKIRRRAETQARSGASQANSTTPSPPSPPQTVVPVQAVVPIRGMTPTTPPQIRAAGDLVAKDLPFGAFIDVVKQSTYNIVFDFAVVLHSAQPSALNDADNDIRKFLFHISRHASVITGVARVPQEGVSAGILLFRIAAHVESVPETQIKNLVTQYLSFLNAISISQRDGSVTHFTDTQRIWDLYNRVIFPGGLTYEDNKKNKTTLSEEPVAQSELVRGKPAINVRELHRRKLCVACRHFLRGMCYRGDACNFCHDPSHVLELEKSSYNQNQNQSGH
jgi:hypothetical protein